MRPLLSPRTWLMGALLACAGCANTTPLPTDTDMEALAAVAQQVQGPQLMESVTELVQLHLEDTPVDCTNWRGEFPPESRWCHLSRGRAGDWMAQRLGELGLQVSRQEGTGQTHTTSNVIAELPGTTHPEEVVVVAAHFDAFFGGADDNSTGVAAVLELARVLSQHRFERTVRFVGFDLEEVGAVGSNRFVAALRQDERLVMSLVLDCIGYYDTRSGSQTSIQGLPSPDVGDFLAAIANAPSDARAAELFALNQELGLLKLVPLIAAADGMVPLGEPLLRSDHSAFWLAGEQSVFLTDTAVFRNPHYHQETDLPETLDAVRFQQAVQLSAVALAFWAGGPR